MTRTTPLVLILLAAVGNSSSSLGARKRSFTVKDSIEMATFSREFANGDGTIARSPNGRWFAAITKRGLLQSNELESSLWIFDSQRLRVSLNAPAKIEGYHPQLLARMSAPGNDEPISHVTWAADSRSIAFLGRKKILERHLFVIDVPQGVVKLVTPKGQDVSDFSRNAEGVVYTVQRGSNIEDLYESGGRSLTSIEIGTGRSLDSLLYPNWNNSIIGVQPNELWTIQKGKPVHIRGSKLAPLHIIGSRILSSSPSGRYAIVTSFVPKVPKLWESYIPAYQRSAMRIVADHSESTPVINLGRPQQYSIVDLHEARMSPLIDAPLGRSAGYFADALVASWSYDEREVVVSNTFLPITNASQGGAPLRPCIAVVEISSFRAKCVRTTFEDNFRAETLPAAVANIEWISPGELLIWCRSQLAADELSIEMLRRNQGRWEHVTDSGQIDKHLPKRHDSDLSLSVRQNLNDPPTVIASDRLARSATELWDPNPQLAKIDLGSAEIYHWYDKTGREWVGGLVKPSDFSKDKHYPLVIQTHRFDQNEFLNDGAYSTANAARALAGREILVLQVGEPRDALETPREAELDGVIGYQAAIEQLASEGTIDREAVGIIGFSRTGWYVLESLIKLPNYFKAATLAEATAGTLGEYLFDADAPPQYARSIVAAVGAEPFGTGLGTWFKNSPGFKTDSIRAPILFEANNPPLLVYCWDIYAALRLQGKPVELLYMRDGQHVLTKPIERYASQETNVDWFDFWLNNHEDPNPDKAAQYSRWRKLRNQREIEHSN